MNEYTNVIDFFLRFGFGSVVAGLVVFLLGKHFLTGFLREKGKNLATREDFNTLLEQVKKTTKETESIRVELSSRNWLNQQQWSIREKYYMELLGNLTKLKLALQDQKDYYMEPGSENDDSHTETDHFNKLSRASAESFQAIRELAGPSSVFLSEAAINAINHLIREHWHTAEFSSCRAEYIENALKLADAAYSAVLDEARSNLGHKPIET